MLDYRPDSGSPSREPIIDGQLLASVVESVQSCMTEDMEKGCACTEPLCEEPVLREFLKERLFTIIGKMAVCRTRPNVMLGVYTDVQVLFNIAFDAARQAHRQLYQELLPGEAEPGDKSPDPGLTAEGR